MRAKKRTGPWNTSLPAVIVTTVARFIPLDSVSLDVGEIFSLYYDKSKMYTCTMKQPKGITGIQHLPTCVCNYINMYRCLMSIA